MSAVAELFEDVARRTPSSFVEMKTASMAWHYRSVEPGLAQQRLSEARARLASIADSSRFELLEGAKVLEVRQRGVNKGLAVARVLGTGEPAAVLAAGDDTTDEDLFAALPPQAVAIHVGDRATRAHYRVVSPDALRKHLAAFLDH
jgi:trehalose 6-phosphate synthase/phosphatase